jgi:hypothetical protein
MSEVLAEGPDFFQPRLSRDESRILFWQFDASGLPQVHPRDRQRENSEKLTTGRPSIHHVWGPGYADITFARAGAPGPSPQDLWAGPVSGPGPWEPLETSPESSVTGNWCGDGQTLVYYRIAGETRRDIWKTSPGETPEPILNSRDDERTPRLSPDCRWLAYISDPTGEDLIYIAPWPELEPRVSILKPGASEPVWSRDGRELYFRVWDEMWAVRVPAAPGSTPEEPRLLFEAPYEPDPWVAGIPNYDVAKDGRFLMVRSNSRGSESITLARNFVANLPNLAPTD